MTLQKMDQKVVFFLTALYNACSRKHISFRDQLVISYCGLRGVISYSLSHMTDGSEIGPRELYMSVTILLIFQTIILQGTTVRYLIELLALHKESFSRHKSLVAEINGNLVTMMLSGLENIARGGGTGSLQIMLSRFDDKIMKRIFVTQESRNAVRDPFQELNVNLVSLLLLRKHRPSIFTDMSNANNNKKFTGLPVTMCKQRNGNKVRAVENGRLQESNGSINNVDLNETLRMAMQSTPFYHRQYRSQQYSGNATGEVSDALIPSLQLQNDQLVIEIRSASDVSNSCVRRFVVPPYDVMSQSQTSERTPTRLLELEYPKSRKKS